MKLHFLLFNVLSAWVLVCSSTFPTSAQNQGQNPSGRIRGTLIFPSDVLLAQKVCAENVKTRKMICVETKQSQPNFSIQAPPGTYYVFAKVCNRSYRSNKFCSDGYGERRAYYNAYVRCGLTYQCEKSVRVNSPIPVKVNSGEIVREVKPHDWYTKQLVPSNIVLPGRCHMGECWDNKFIEKKLLKEGSSGNLYSIKTASRSWSMGSQPPKSFGEVELSYVYCSRKKPSVIFICDI